MALFCHRILSAKRQRVYSQVRQFCRLGLAPVSRACHYPTTPLRISLVAAQRISPEALGTSKKAWIPHGTRDKSAKYVRLEGIAASKTSAYIYAIMSIDLA